VPVEGLGFNAGQAISIKECDSLLDDFIEGARFDFLHTAREARTNQAHGETMAGQNSDAACIITDEIVQASPDFDRRVPIVN
jgi:hypothetical protein